MILKITRIICNVQNNSQVRCPGGEYLYISYRIWTWILTWEESKRSWLIVSSEFGLEDEEKLCILFFLLFCLFLKERIKREREKEAPGRDLLRWRVHTYLEGEREREGVRGEERESESYHEKYSPVWANETEKDNTRVRGLLSDYCCYFLLFVFSILFHILMFPLYFFSLKLVSSSAAAFYVNVS